MNPSVVRQAGVATTFAVREAMMLLTVPTQEFWEKVREGLQRVTAIWTYELTTIDGRSLTVGKVTIALLVLLIGIPIAKIVIRKISQRLFTRIGLGTASSAAFQALFFYLVVAILTVFALWVSEIPLTVFTLAGGAIAIGIGFGSQRIVNNFVSGLILLVERPIKVGDLIEVGDTFGEVENVGARSTKIRSFDNFHIIVPNSAFLEQNVINWTHTDNMVRISLRVGVAYGSPTRQVEELIQQAVRELDQVIIPPEPVVLFEDFGDSALLFEALFWVLMKRPMDRRRALSAVRFRIDELFRKNGIVIAFPQRDVHLDNLKPLEVRLTSGDSDERASGLHGVGDVGKQPDRGRAAETAPTRDEEG
ncbi:MAG: mechanosensitive ion channel [Acidobacteriota bacterium]